MDNNQMTSLEAADKQRLSARKESVIRAAEKILSAINAAGEIKSTKVYAANMLRDAGLYLIEASGRTRLIFNSDGMVFLREHVLPHMPAGTAIELLKMAVHLAATIEKPFQNYEEYSQYVFEFQAIDKQLGVTCSQQIHEAGECVAPKNHFLTVVCGIDSVRVKLQKMIEQKPVETWSPWELDSFLGRWQVVEEFVAKARQAASRLADEKASA